MRSSADHLGRRGFGTFRNLGPGLVGALIDVGLQRFSQLVECLSGLDAHEAAVVVNT